MSAMVQVHAQATAGQVPTAAVAEVLQAWDAQAATLQVQAQAREVQAQAPAAAAVRQADLQAHLHQAVAAHRAAADNDDNPI